MSRELFYALSDPFIQGFKRSLVQRVARAKIDDLLPENTTILGEYPADKCRDAQACELPDFGKSHMAGAATLAQHFVQNFHENWRAVDERAVEVKYDVLYRAHHSGTRMASTSSSRGRNGARS